MPLRATLLASALALLSLAGLAQTSSASIQGQVRDALGRPVAGASVALLAAGGATLAQTRTDARGRYALALPAGAVTLRAQAPGLAAAGEPVSPHPAVLTLGLATVETAVNVTALGVPLPEAQVGSAVSDVSGAALRALDPLQAVAALRLTPGVGVVQSGQTGGVTSVFLRGAPSDFTEVLLDGAPIQRLDLGGYDFSNLLPAGLDDIQVLRGPDSVIYGSAAAAGVIALRTRRGDAVEAPEFDSSTEAGAYGTLVQDDELLGRWRAGDYAFRFGYLGTHNQLPDSKFRDNSYGANLGWRFTPTSQARFVLNRGFSDAAQPNALLFYGLPEGAFKHQGETYARAEYSSQLTPRWRQRITAGESASNLFSEIPGPAGIPDGMGDYDGLPVTIRGANGYGASGQAILSFGGPFPQLSPSDTLRRDADWESELSLGAQASLVADYRYYDERGLSSEVALSRHDSGAYAAAQGALGPRLFLGGGASLDRNTPFGVTANPQASAAYYPRLGRSGWWDETRLRASAGTALKDPSLVEEEFSLYQELVGAAGGAALVRQFGLAPIQPQRARDLDIGLDQYVAQGRGLLSATWFDQRYYNLIEDIPNTAFPALGIPNAVAQAAPEGGEYNSLTERARGLELEARLRLGAHWQLGGSYTATAARVLRSFSFDAQAPTVNPNLPNVPIGAFAPLVGARPFRVPPQAAGLEARYGRGRFSGVASAVFESRRDDSTFLTDAAFGNTLLLPNRNLDPAFGVLNLSGTWRLSPRLELLAAVDNALDQAYQEVIGYPAPRLGGRLGVRWTWNPPLPH